MSEPNAEYAGVDPAAVLPKKRDIIERIMTQHWDFAACGCWVCVAGRAAGCRPMTHHQEHNHGVVKMPRIPIVGPDFLRTHSVSDGGV